MKLLPQKFLGTLPLYLGVEIVLGISIFNKAGGVYGFLSIFTGHPINFFQWLWNIFCIAVLPFYISSLLTLRDIRVPRNTRRMCLCTVVFLVDTAVGMAYTLYFVRFWFQNEENSASADYVQSEQSASQARELFFISSTTLVVSAVRAYFALAVLSFTKQLLKFAGEDPADDVSGNGRVQRVLDGWERRAKNLMEVYLL